MKALLLRDAGIIDIEFVFGKIHAVDGSADIFFTHTDLIQNIHFQPTDLKAALSRQPFMNFEKTAQIVNISIAA